MSDDRKNNNNNISCNYYFQLKDSAPNKETELKTIIKGLTSKGVFNKSDGSRNLAKLILKRKVI